MILRALISAALTAGGLTAAGVYWSPPTPVNTVTEQAALHYVAPEPRPTDTAEHGKSVRALAEAKIAEAPGLSALLPYTPVKQTLFVSPNGSDSAAGTLAAPFKTIDKAASVATPGTTVRVAAGSYTGSVKTSADGTKDARIVYIAETKWAVKIKGEGGGAAWHNVGDYVDIVGFDITGPNVDGILHESSYGRIAGNRIHGFTEGTCLQTENNGYTLHDNDIIGNLTFNCGANSLHHGIYVSYPNGTVSNNISFGHAGYGIHCWHNCNKLTITNNLVFDNEEGGMVIGQGDNPNNGRVDADNFLVANNIAVFNGNHGIKESGATGSKNEYVNNNVFGNKRGGYKLRGGKATGTINEDPQFVDFKMDGSGDYRLKPTSPNVNAGVKTGAPLTDLLGTPRPRGGGVDVGVYEL